MFVVVIMWKKLTEWHRNSEAGPDRLQKEEGEGNMSFVKLTLVDWSPEREGNTVRFLFY